MRAHVFHRPVFASHVTPHILPGMCLIGAIEISKLVLQRPKEANTGCAART